MLDKIKRVYRKRNHNIKNYIMVSLAVGFIFGARFGVLYSVVGIIFGVIAYRLAEMADEKGE